MPCGAFRYVILIGALAVKIPRLRNFSGGMRSNRWEREMWQKWRPIFRWQTLCPVYLADPAGLFLVMPRAKQPVTSEDVDALPDYYPSVTSETKAEDYGRLGPDIVTLDYGLPYTEDVIRQRQYYGEKAESPAMVLSK
jgi:hypothetical protein